MEKGIRLLPIKRVEAAWIKVRKSEVDDKTPERFKYKRKLILVPYRYEKNWVVDEHGNKTLDVKKLYRCHYCECCNFTENEITKDHKIPQSKGGTDSIKNIVPACLECNRDKADTPYDEYIRIIQARKKIKDKKLKDKKNENENTIKKNYDVVIEHDNTNRSNGKLRKRHKTRIHNSKRR